MRSILALIIIITAACSNPSKADPAPTSARNLVCERWHVLNGKAQCEPEYTDAGEGHIHTARVTFEGKDGKTVACGISVGQLGMMCGPLIAEAKQAESAISPPAPGAGAKGAKK